MDIITADEKTQLEQRLADLRGRRIELKERIAEARALGDLKENADYHAAREDQALNEANIRGLEEKLARSSVADNSIVPDDMVFVGATFKLRDVTTGDEDVYRLVGEPSSDFSADWIEVSAKSPLGDALLKRRVGETVHVVLPKGKKQFEVLEIL